MGSLLSVQNLSVQIQKEKQILFPVNRTSFDLPEGEITGLVGESGCGKTLTALSIAGLLPAVAKASGSVLFNSPVRDLLTLKEDELCKVRGREISMIFQEPFSSLNPLMKIGNQITEALEIHGRNDKRQNKNILLELLIKLGFEDPKRIMRTYPSRISGGMCQRVMIALAMICGPRLLIADEPTTALDISTQDQIIELLKTINRDLGTSILFISHDLGLVRRLCSWIMVMYAGRIIEEGIAEEVFLHPAHEYTKGLLEALPERKQRGENLFAIPGRPPILGEEQIRGCAFAPRCQRAAEKCRIEPISEIIINKNHRSYCIMDTP